MTRIRYRPRFSLPLFGAAQFIRFGEHALMIPRSLGRPSHEIPYPALQAWQVERGRRRTTLHLVTPAGTISLTEAQLGGADALRELLAELERRVLGVSGEGALRPAADC